MTREPELPQNVEAEAGVLGSILIDPEALRQVADYLAPADFYTEQHRTIYQAAVDLHRDGTPTDLLTLCDELGRRGKLDEVGGASYVSSLANQVPTSRNVAHYAEIVQRCAVARRLIDASGDIAAAAYGEMSDAEGMVEYCLTLVRNAGSEGRSRKGAYHLQSVKDMLNQPPPEPLIEGIYSRNSTGLMYAPPGVGKTVLLLDQMAHVALGRDWLGHAVTGGHVVYVCAEGQAFLPERLKALMQKLKVDDIPRLHILAARPQLLDTRTVSHLLRTFEAELPEPPVWIAFDTVSQTANGARENDADAMGPYLGAMERIREATKAFVDAIHHTGKDEDRGPRGSSLLSGNTDTVVQVTQSDGVSVVKCHKQRGGWAQFKPFSFKVTPLLLDDDTGRTGPIAEACDLPPETGEKQRKLPVQVQKAYDIFQRLFAHYQAERSAGVFPKTWQEECAKANIPEGTFKYARTQLANTFKLIYQPRDDGQWYLVAPAGDEGMNGDDCPGLSQDGAGMDKSKTLGGLSYPSQPDLCPETGGAHIYAMRRTAKGRRVCTECGQPEEAEVSA